MSRPPPLLPAMRRSLRKAGLIWIICSLCILIEAALQLGDAGLIPLPRLRSTIYEYAGFWPGLMGPWTPNYPLQPYTMFVSYAFLHGGLLHLVFNMLTLVSLGLAVIERVGQRGFAILFTAAVLGGAFGYGLLTNAPNPMVGASGGLFGLAGGILAWNYIDRFAAARRLWPVVQAILGLVALNVILWWLMDGHLAWETHLGGFVAGWVAAMLIDPRSQKAPNSRDPAHDSPETATAPFPDPGEDGRKPLAAQESATKSR